MIFRILTNGTWFRAQVKSFLWWSFINEWWSSGAFGGKYPREFLSDESVVAYIRKEYGESAQIVRPWHI